MNKSDQLWEEFRKIVYNQKLKSKFNNSLPVIVLAGPTMVIESIVRTAAKTSGIEMDWCYFGGRALIYADGNAEIARHAIQDCRVQGLD